MKIITKVLLPIVVILLCVILIHIFTKNGQGTVPPYQSNADSVTILKKQYAKLESEYKQQTLLLHKMDSLILKKKKYIPKIDTIYYEKAINISNLNADGVTEYLSDCLSKETNN